MLVEQTFPPGATMGHMLIIAEQSHLFTGFLKFSSHNELVQDQVHLHKHICSAMEVPHTTHTWAEAAAAGKTIYEDICTNYDWGNFNGFLYSGTGWRDTENTGEDASKLSPSTTKSRDQVCIG